MAKKPPIGAGGGHLDADGVQYVEAPGLPGVLVFGYDTPSIIVSSDGKVCVSVQMKGSSRAKVLDTTPRLVYVRINEHIYSIALDLSEIINGTLPNIKDFWVWNILLTRELGFSVTGEGTVDVTIDGYVSTAGIIMDGVVLGQCVFPRTTYTLAVPKRTSVSPPTNLTFSPATITAGQKPLLTFGASPSQQSCYNLTYDVGLQYKNSSGVWTDLLTRRTRNLAMVWGTSNAFSANTTYRFFVYADNQDSSGSLPILNSQTRSSVIYSPEFTTAATPTDRPYNPIITPSNANRSSLNVGDTATLSWSIQSWGSYTGVWVYLYCDDTLAMSITNLQSWANMQYDDSVKRTSITMPALPEAMYGHYVSFAVCMHVGSTSSPMSIRSAKWKVGKDRCVKIISSSGSVSTAQRISIIGGAGVNSEQPFFDVPTNKIIKIGGA